MAPQQKSHNKKIPSVQPAAFLTTLRNLRRSPLLRSFFAAPASRTRPSRPTKSQKARDLDTIECLRREAEAAFDLHDCMERWMRGDDPIFGFPSQHWKDMHPQMNYHLQRIRHREQHEIWGATRLPACKEKDRATIAFLNCGGDPEETRCWPEGIEEEFLDSLIWQWKTDTGV